MQALISPDELVHGPSGDVVGQRVAEVAQHAFDVAPPLFWVPCPDDCVANLWYYNGGELVALPIPPAPPPPDIDLSDNTLEF
jgi:hypothetical protein